MQNIFLGGYRFRFFGQDAITAAQCLPIIAHRQHNYIVASFPTYRILLHARALLNKGIKV